MASIGNTNITFSIDFVVIRLLKKSLVGTNIVMKNYLHIRRLITVIFRYHGPRSRAQQRMLGRLETKTQDKFHQKPYKIKSVWWGNCRFPSPVDKGPGPSVP